MNLKVESQDQNDDDNTMNSKDSDGEGGVSLNDGKNLDEWDDMYQEDKNDENQSGRDDKDGPRNNGSKDADRNSWG
jgi:U3 small nucleolar RNA-associated protein 14